MKSHIYLVLLALSLALSSCFSSTNDKNADNNVITDKQQILLDEGWQFQTPPNGDMALEYGITPVKGLLDNYFDIEVGGGFSVAVKIVEASSKKTIRYVYVKENSTATITEIPPGDYYLKLAFGYDWMTKEDNEKLLGKFTKLASYEISDDVFVFGNNMFNANSYQLRINMNADERYYNFSTTEIDENEFFNETPYNYYMI